MKNSKCTKKESIEQNLIKLSNYLKKRNYKKLDCCLIFEFCNEPISILKVEEFEIYICQYSDTSFVVLRYNNRTTILYYEIEFFIELKKINTENILSDLKIKILK